MLSGFEHVVEGFKKFDENIGYPYFVQKSFLTESKFRKVFFSAQSTIDKLLRYLQKLYDISQRILSTLVSNNGEKPVDSSQVIMLSCLENSNRHQKINVIIHNQQII